jgi:hypothetical protein
MLKTRDFICDAEVHELVDAFEAATIAPSQFNHAAHIATALSYLATLPFADASARMRTALLRFTTRHGIDVYHENDHHFLDAFNSSSRPRSLSRCAALLTH